MEDLEQELKQFTESVQKLDPMILSLDDFFGATIRFFEKFSAIAEALPEQQKKEWSGKLQEISQQIEGGVQKFISAAEMSEEELLQVAEHKESFGPEKWALYDEARRQVTDFAKKISSALAQPTAPSEVPQQPKKDIHRHHPKRSEWMKS